ncbi:MAG: capsule assembly Wzi family protein [Bacteroidetes bacterium]|nr:capsule assembly Wzi family protein [Bacteroidota bacterium]MBU1115100.1 capsule assembly Wzi family protein [Bacteroidota bacterium]MBU1798712.1 capsule assembly Wzi family protein [Bacteroidota bacterium]
MNKNITKILLLLLLNTLLYGQINYEPLHKSIYNYLDNISAQGYIVLNTEIKPFSRIYIANKLIEIFNSKNGITRIEEDELFFYLRDFSNELTNLGFEISQLPKSDMSDYNIWNHVGFNKAGRFHLFDYKNESFTFKLDPIYGYSSASSDSINSTHFWNGLNLYGSISDFIGFELNFRDNSADGNVDRTRAFSPKTGYSFKVSREDGSMEFDEVNANLTFSNNWASLTLGKDYIYYGEGTQGKIILGNKAPSFPHIKLEVNPVEWFRFSYVYGWLNSQVIDSSTIRYNEDGSQTFKHIPKYYVAHMFSFTPLNSLNLSIGESVVYSDSFEPVYLIPVLFFRLADHYLTVPDNAAGNAQLFGSFWYNYSKINTRFYGSVYIDEFSVQTMLAGTPGPKAVAYTIGASVVNPYVEDLQINVEYSKLDPFVYFHRDDAQMYTNYNYQLGHWIGSNSDQFYISANKTIFRGLNAKLWYSYVRRGERESADEPRYQEKHVFLWGLNTQYSNWGFGISYEPIHDVLIRASYQSFLTSTQQENGNFIDIRRNEFFMSLNYGF